MSNSHSYIYLTHEMRATTATACPAFPRVTFDANPEKIRGESDTGSKTPVSGVRVTCPCSVVCRALSELRCSPFSTSKMITFIWGHTLVMINYSLPDAHNIRQ